MVAGAGVAAVGAGESTGSAGVVGCAGSGRIADEIIDAAVAVAPDVAQVEPVADLVGGRAAQVEGRRSGADGAEVGVVDHHAVCGGSTAGKLGIAQNAAADITDPKIEVAAGRPGILTTTGVELHIVIGAECRHRSGGAGDAICWVPTGVNRSQAELDLCVGSYRSEQARGVGCIRIEPAEVLVQYRDLALDLSIAHVFSGGIVHHMDDHRNGDDAVHRPFRVGQILFGMLFDFLEFQSPAGVQKLFELHVLHGPAIADLGDQGSADAKHQQQAQVNVLYAHSRAILVCERMNEFRLRLIAAPLGSYASCGAGFSG